MSGKINNKTLFLVLLALAAVFAITRFFPGKRSDRSLASGMVQIDTVRITSLQLFPAAEQGEVIGCLKEGGSWNVTHGGITARADQRMVTSILGELQGLKAEQLVSRSKDSWAEYMVTDSLGTRVVVKEGNRTTLDMVVGRFHYQPPAQESYNPYGQNQVSGKTYVRLYKGDEVYSVAGFLAMSVNQTFDRWRDQTVTRFTPSQITRISFDYPADSGYIAEKSEAGWMVAGILADSSSIASYLNRASRKTLREFKDGFTPGGDPLYRVSFEGDNMQPLEVRAYPEDEGSIILSSTLNPGTWFRTTRDELFRDLFPDAGKLLPPSMPDIQ